MLSILPRSTFEAQKPDRHWKRTVLCGTNEVLHLARRRFPIWNRICSRRDVINNLEKLRKHKAYVLHFIYALHHGLLSGFRDRGCLGVSGLRLRESLGGRPYQTFAVQESCAPFFAVAHFVKLITWLRCLDRANILLLLLQTAFVILSQALQGIENKWRSHNLWDFNNPFRVKSWLQCTYQSKHLQADLCTHRGQLIHRKSLPFLHISILKLLSTWYSDVPYVGAWQALRVLLPCVHWTNVIKSQYTHPLRGRLI